MYTLVVIESPYAPSTPKHPGECDCAYYNHMMCEWHSVEEVRKEELERNIRYCRAAMKDCLNRGEAPYASHLLYTQKGVLDDEIPAERVQGIEAGFAWRQVAAKTVVYTDLGISKGMQYGIDDAIKRGCPVEYRTLPGWSK